MFCLLVFVNWIKCFNLDNFSLDLKPDFTLRNQYSYYCIIYLIEIHTIKYI